MDAVASVIIATRNRPEELSTCLAALKVQATSRRYEIIVVDDGSSPPLRPDSVTPGYCLRIPGRGPATARNHGISAAQGDVILFTDDDTVPAPGWIEAACTFLDTNPGYVGVEGPTASRPVDELYEYTVANEVPGAYWTCNVAYRRAVLDKVGGFCETFPWPHGEDVDLGLRIARLGPIGFAADMQVTHTPRAVSLFDILKRGRFVSSDLLLYFRYPDLYRERPGVPRLTYPFVAILRHWWRYLVAQRETLITSPRRLVRLLVAVSGQLLVAAVNVAAASRGLQAR